MMYLSPKNKISVAPNFFNYNEYFEESNKSFSSWISRQISKIEKKYGQECMQRIQKGEIPLDEKVEKKLNKTLKGRDLKELREKELDCFLAFAHLNDLAVMQKAFYSSFLIYIFSECEYTLDSVCREYARKTKQEIGLKDISGSGIERSIKYLSKVAKFTIPDGGLKDKLFLMRDIRNCLAHSGAIINDTNPLSRLKKMEFVSLLKDDFSENYELFFDEKYCKHWIDIISKFLKLLVKYNTRYLWHWSVKT